MFPFERQRALPIFLKLAYKINGNYLFKMRFYQNNRPLKA